MSRLILIVLCFVFFSIGCFLPSSNVLSYGRYQSETISHIVIKGGRDSLTMKLHTELELNKDNTYDLITLTHNKSGSFTKGTYKYDGEAISLYEREHESFLSSDVIVPFWEQVVVSPGTMAREGTQVIPYGKGNAFILFSDRTAALYKSSTGY